MKKNIVMPVIATASEVAQCEALVQAAELNAPILNGQKIIQIPLNLLAVDHEYQREIHGARWQKVINIAESFNAQKANLVLVSYRNNGRFYIIDGQGRYESALKAGLKAIMCHVVTDISVVDEAELFLSQDENAVRVSLHDKYRAGCVAKHDDCLKLKAILEKYGVKKASNISAIGTALEIADSDPDALEWVLTTIIRADWADMNNGFSKPVIKGLYELYKREVLPVNSKTSRRIETVLIPMMKANSPSAFLNVSGLLYNRAKGRSLNMFTLFSGIVSYGNKSLMKRLEACNLEVPAGSTTGVTA